MTFPLCHVGLVWPIAFRLAVIIAAGWGVGPLGEDQPKLTSTSQVSDPKAPSLGFSMRDLDVPSKVVGLDAARDKYMITRYTLPDSVAGDRLLISRAGMPVAILEVVSVHPGQATAGALLARRWAVDPSRGIEIGDDARPFRVIEDRPVR
jgi:hypothetical protein